MNYELKNMAKHAKFYAEIQKIRFNIENLIETRVYLDARASAVAIQKIKERLSDIRYISCNNDELIQCEKHLDQVSVICNLMRRCGKKEDLLYLIYHEINILYRYSIYVDERLLRYKFDTLNFVDVNKYIASSKKKLKLKGKEAKESIAKELDDLELKLNGVSKQEKDLTKNTLENLYFLAAVFLASIPILSGLGFLFLQIYLSRINSSIFFMDIMAEGGINGVLFSAAIVFFFGITQLLLPYLIIFSQQNKSNLFERMIFIPMIFIALFLSWIGFWSISTFWGALVPAIYWIGAVWFGRYLYKLSGVRRGEPKAKIAVIVLLPFVLIFVTIHSSSILQFFNLSAGLRLENIFRTIDFVQEDYSWFKINHLYYERTGLRPSNLKNKSKNFVNEYSKLDLVSNGDDVFLYGKLWVNTNNLKILCPPSKIRLQEKEDGTKIDDPIDIKADEVNKKCFVFRADELQSMMGFAKLPKN